MQFADKVGPDECAYLCSLIWAFSVRQHILQYSLILKADNEGPDQPVLLRMLIRVCVDCKLHEDPFRAMCIICILNIGTPLPYIS